MNLLSVNNLSKSFGDKILFNNITFGIAQGEKVALVAKNGSGKSTLFKILKGIEIPDTGEAVFRKDIQVGFLDQDFSFNETKSINDYITNADNRFALCYMKYNDAVKKCNDSNSVINQKNLEEAIEEMNRLEAWDYEKQIKEILSSLGLNDLNQKIRELSGGQRKRLALALLLINQPDLMIMDEPTNHLDLEMIEWLENYLSNKNLSILLVTHDRYFLDAVCRRILELEDFKIYEYNGDFEYYLEKKNERIDIQKSEFEKNLNRYKRELEWIRKMPKARTTKSKSRIDAFYEIENKIKNRRSENKLELSVKTERLGSKTVEIHKVTKVYPAKIIISEPFTYTFIPGERVGLLGKNGTGKTTLLKMIQGLENPDSGKINIGETVVFGYYSQAGMKIDSDKRIIEVIRDIAEYIPLANGTQLSASQLLTRFNFPPKVQYSYSHTLSGGEKRRLYLLTILMRNPNFLILDEPTNDLDIITLETLEEFLLDFSGCVLIVSHDRYFIDKIVDHVFVLEGNGAIKDFPGNYTEYKIWSSNNQDNSISKELVDKSEPKEVHKSENPAKKLSYKIQRELESLENEIPTLEKSKKELEEQITNASDNYEKVMALSEKISRINEELEFKSSRWLEIQEMLL
ncbi:MAG: ABC-F family ATP-binding cassette domain-containing protein [Bacteroidia bacterium]